MSTGVFSYLHEDLIQMITKLLLEENKVQETLNVAYADTRLKLLHNDTFWEGRCKEKGWIQKVPTISWEENYIWYLGQQAYWDQITLVNRIDSQIDGRAISHFMRSSMSDWNNEWHIYNSEREKDVHAAYPSHKFSVENSWIRTPMDAKKKERHVIYTATSNDGMHCILTTRLYRCNRPFMYITLYNFNQANKKFELEKELLGEYGVDEAYCKLISPPIISPYNDFVAYVFNFRGEHSTKSYSKFLERYVDYGSMTKCFLTHLSNTKYSRDFECGPIACIAFDNSSIHTPGRLLISSTPLTLRLLEKEIFSLNPTWQVTPMGLYASSILLSFSVKPPLAGPFRPLPASFPRVSFWSAAVNFSSSILELSCTKLKFYV